MALTLAGRKSIGKVRVKAYQGKTRRDRQIKAKKRELYEYRKEHKDKLAMLDVTTHPPALNERNIQLLFQCGSWDES